ncbi:hypothetical protein CRUP_032677 [Coryphaenoides rupestris]|nr:hypothetical protein CRUP_032677 [Coryphaenoides rupestris]
MKGLKGLLCAAFDSAEEGARNRPAGEEEDESEVGRLGRRQVISLQKGGCVYTNVIQHEVLHALGFHHEQARSDRDDHVEILTKNIDPGANLI